MASIDGLASGLNTTEIIGQLMQLERLPQLRLQQSLQRTDRAIQALQGLNTRFGAIKTAAEALTKPAGWHPATTSSSDDSVATASATAGAPPARLSFRVTQLATAGSAVSTGAVGGLSEVVAAGASIELAKGATTHTIDVGDGTLSSVVRAINDADVGVTATAVQVSPGQYKLQLASTTTGADTAISVGAGAFVAGTLGDVVELSAARDATIEVGDTNPYTVTRSSNTISDLLDGVTLTLRATGDATVEVAADQDAVVNAVKAFVDGVNAAIGDIKTRTAGGPTAGPNAVLAGDGMLRNLQTRLVGAFAQGTDVDGTSHGASQLGLAIERDGTISFDQARFRAALEEDPELVQAVLGEGGLADRVKDIAASATAPARDSGLIASAIEGRERQKTRTTADIARWDDRLELRERVLVRQFTALESALAAAQAQGQWLSGQLAGLQANLNA